MDVMSILMIKKAKLRKELETKTVPSEDEIKISQMNEIEATIDKVADILDSNTEADICRNCLGTGHIPNVDDIGNITQVICSECNGTGFAKKV